MDNWSYVCETPTGYGLFRKKNLAGGYDYATDEVGAIIWDTALVAECDILCSIVEEHHRRMNELHRKQK